MAEEQRQAEFLDGKAPGALRTIGEVAATLGIKQHVLRYWEQQFPMLRPLKRSGGRRYYRTEDVELLALIHRLIDLEGYTLKGARQVVEKRARELGVTPVAPTETVPSSQAATPAIPAQLLDRLQAIRARLASALAA